MSAIECIKAKLEKITRIGAEIATCLLENPRCLDGESQKHKAYQVAIQYFTDKQDASQSTESNSYNWAEAIRLGVLIECYTDQKGNKKQEYARQIACYLLQTQEYWLRLIPDETKNAAFQIAIQYLEEQMGS